MGIVKVHNPIKEAREALRMSQETFARECGTSKQAVIRAEQGCYALPTPAIMSYLKYHQTRYDLDEQVFLTQYRQYQRERRQMAYGMLSPLFVFKVVNPAQHPFVAWRLSSQLNQTQVCKFWCLHPAIIYKFEKQPHLMNDLPESLVGALLESGYREEYLRELSAAYKRHKDYLASLVSYGSDG